MTNSPIVVEGVVKGDGTLELKGLPAGRVQVTIQSIPGPTQPDRFWNVMESIWSDLKTNGRIPRSKEAIDAEIEVLREDAEKEMQEVERLEEDCFQNGNRPEKNGSSGTS